MSIEDEPNWDANGFAFGEFSDTDSTKYMTKEKTGRPLNATSEISYYEKFMQTCYEKGLSPEESSEEWRAFISCFGD